MSFFFNDTATTEIYTLSLHDALPIWSGERLVGLERDVEVDGGAPAAPFGRVHRQVRAADQGVDVGVGPGERDAEAGTDRKSTRLNSSHANISYAVFCLKKKQTHYSLL